MLTNLIKAILIGSMLCNSAMALEFKDHKQVVTDDTTIVNGEHIEN